MHRDMIVRVLLVVYALGCVAVAVPLLFDIGRTGELANTTSGKILVAALLAIGLGALAAARDPWHNRLMIQVAIVFAALSSLAIIYRLAFEDYSNDPAWMLLPFALAAPVLLGIFYPRGPGD